MPKAVPWIALPILALAPSNIARADTNAAAQVRDVDAQFRHAMIAGDAATLDRMVANDARIIHGKNSGVQDKPGLIANFRSWRFETYDRTPILTRVSGNMAVLVAYTHKRHGGHQADTSTTEVVVRRHRQWQILVLQNTDHAAE